MEDDSIYYVFLKGQKEITKQKIPNKVKTTKEQY